MTRYFYTCPLESAYMAKHYGMDFEIWRWDNCEWNFAAMHDRKKQRNGVTMSVASKILQNRGANRFYIHPDSLHLLVLQKDDILITAANGVSAPYAVAKVNDDNGAASLYSASNIKLGMSMFDSWKIIQRNGLAFMWPEREG